MGLPARPAARPRHLVDLQPVDLAATRETQQRVVAVRDEQLVDEVLALDLRRRPSAAAAALGLVAVEPLGLRVTAVGDRHDDVFHRNQVLDRQLVLELDNFGAALVAVALAHLVRALHGSPAISLSGSVKNLSKFFNIYQ